MIVEDREFGEVVVRKNSLSRGIRASVSTSGRLCVSVPFSLTRLGMVRVRNFLEENREEIKAKLPIKDPKTQRARDMKKKLLAKSAKEYLPYRLEFFAKKFGYKYEKCRLSHANTRWGSCSSNGTISLNIGLMNVPEILRDYVIIHELAHLNHMDHSAEFWKEVGEHDKNYQEHRRKLKFFSPGV